MSDASHDDHSQGHSAPTSSPLDSIREKYVTFIENLASKGVPAPHVIIPLVLILIIAGAALYATGNIPSLGGKSVTLTITTESTIPVSFANIAILSNEGDTIQSLQADENGIAKIDNLQNGQSIKITSDGFTPKTLDFSELNEKEQSVTLSTKPLDAKTINVKIVDETGIPVPYALVSLSFSDGTSAPSQSTDASGNAQLEIDAAKDQGASVSIDAQGYTSTPQTITFEQIQSGTPITLRVSSGQTQVINPDVKSGEYTVKVTSDANLLEKAKVQLIDTQTSNVLKTQFTQEDGTALFSNLDYGTNFYVKAKLAGYEEYTSTEITFTKEFPSLEINLNVKTKDTKITIIVQSQNTPIEAATLSLFDSNTNQLIATTTTQTNGQAQFDVPDKTNAYATISANGYLLSFASNLKAGMQKTISLQAATESNTVNVNVLTAQSGFPTANTKVALYRTGGFNLGIPELYTNAEGIVTTTIPVQIENAPYAVYAKASADSGLAGQSDIVQVNAGAQVNLPVELIAPPAKLTITTNDVTTNNPIPSATVNILIENSITSTCTTDSNGKCTLNVTPDKQFQVNVQTNEYTAYTTELMTAASANTKELTLSLFPANLSNAVNLALIGIYDSKGVKVKEISNAQLYSAKFLLTIPSTTDKAGFYLRLGDEATAIDSQAAITKFDASEAEFTQSSSSYDEASTNCLEGEATNGEALKWIYLQYPKGYTGSKEISVQFKVSKNAIEPIKLNYRAFSYKNNAPSLSPTDAQTLNALQTQSRKTQLTPLDTCGAKLLTHEIKLSPFTLTCTADSELEICYAATLTTQDQTSQTLQATIGKTATLNLDVLSPLPVDQIGVSAENYKVTTTQTLKKQNTLSFADENQPLQAPNLQLVPVVIPANQKTKLAISLTPLKLSPSTPIKITLFSGKQKVELELQSSITGTNTFKVQTAPMQIPVATQNTVNIKVLDRFGNLVPEATVALYECDASPFNGNEPNEQTSEDGKYKFKITPTGLGEIGVRVTSEGFKNFEQCMITTIAKDFIQINPESLEFSGLTNTPETQRVTVTNTLNEPIRATASLNCFGDAIPLKIFPVALSIDADSENSFSLKPIENTTSNSQCLLTINAQVGQYRDSQEIPITNQLSCPGCTSATNTSLQNALPKQIILTPYPPYYSDSQTINVKLSAAPKCTITNFRASNPQVSLPPYQTGVLAGLPGVASFTCDYCKTIGNGNFACNMCHSQAVGTQSPFVCGICQPSTPIAATGANALFTQATCQQCATAYTQQRVLAYQTPQLAYGAQPIPVGVQTYGFDRTSGQPLRTDTDLGNVYQQYPRLPSGYFPGTTGYPSYLQTQYSQTTLGSNQYGKFNWKDALTTDCTDSEITVTADFAQIGQPLSGTATLKVTLPDGTTKDIQVLIQGAAQQAISLEPQYAPELAQYEKCSLSSQYDCKVDSESFATNFEVTHTCTAPLDTQKATLVLDNGKDLGPENCKAELNAQGKIALKCDFSKSQEAKDALESGEQLNVKFTFTSTRSPDTKLDVTCKATLPNVVSQPAPEPKPAPTPSPTPGPTPGPTPQPVQENELKFTVIPATGGSDVCADTQESATTVPAGKFQMQLSYRPAGREPNIKITQTAPETTTATDFQVYTRKELTENIPGDFVKTVILSTLKEDPTKPTLYTFFASAAGTPVLARTCYVKVAPSGLLTFKLQASQQIGLTRPYVDPQGLPTQGSDFYNLPLTDAYMPTNNRNYSLRINTTVDLPKLVAQNMGSFTIVSTYKCDAIEIAKTTSEFTLKKQGAKLLPEITKATHTYNGANAPDNIISAILFQKALNDAKDSSTQCQVTVQLTKSADATTSATLDEKTQTFTVYNYPEAARDTQGDLNKPYTACGTLSTSVLDFANMQVIRNGQKISIKNGDFLQPDDKLEFSTCATTSLPTTIYAETTNGLKQIGSTTPIQSQGALIQTMQTTQTLKELLKGVRLGSSISFKIQNGQAASAASIPECQPGLAFNPVTCVQKQTPTATTSGAFTYRYYCQQWPNDATCDTNKATYKYGTTNPDLPWNCQPGNPDEPENLNELICDVEVGQDSIRTPAGQKIKFTGFDKPEGFLGTLTGDEAFFSVTGPKTTYDCDNGPWAESDLQTDSPGDYDICDVGGPLQWYETTPFVKLTFIKKLPTDEIAIGRTEPSVNRVFRIGISTAFSSDSQNNNWFNKYYKYNFRFNDDTKLKPAIPDHPGLYILNPNDAVRLEDTHFTARYVGNYQRGSTTQALFEVRDEEGILIDCNVDPEGVVLGTAALAGGALAGKAVAVAVLGSASFSAVFIPYTSIYLGLITPAAKATAAGIATGAGTAGVVAGIGWAVDKLASLDDIFEYVDMDGKDVEDCGDYISVGNRPDVRFKVVASKDAPKGTALVYDVKKKEILTDKEIEFTGTTICAWIGSEDSFDRNSKDLNYQKACGSDFKTLD